MVRSLPFRGLTEGAILAAIAAVLALAANYVPLLGAAAFFLCPLPLTVLTVRQGVRIALLAALVAAAIGTMVGGLLTGFSVAVAFAPSGIAMGIGIRQKLSAGSVWLLTAGVAVASIVVSIGLAMLGVGLDPRRLLLESIQQSHESQQIIIRVYERLGVNTAAVRTVVEQAQQVMDQLPRLVPFMLVAAGASIAYINLVVGRAVLRRLGLSVPAFPPMSAWRVPAWFLWVLPVGVLFLLLSRSAVVPLHISTDTLRMLPPDDLAAIRYEAPTRYPAMEAAGMNLTVFAQAVFSLLGMMVGWVLMEKYSMPRWYRYIILFLAMSTPLFSVVALVLGLADAIYDLRGRWRLAAQVGTSS